MAALTYREMAEVLGVSHCGGITAQGSYCRLGDHHLAGFTTEGTVHLHEPTRVDRRDALAFFKLAAGVLDPTLNDDVPWRRVYRRYVAVQNAAARFHMRYEPRHWKADKAFVLAGTAGLSNEVPLRKQAYDWARRTGRSTVNTRLKLIT
jgi:hypothetical protein